MLPEMRSFIKKKHHLEKRWNVVHKLISNSQKIVSSTHINPDGDGLGSQMALVSFLLGQGKKCKILNPSPLPEEMSFLAEYTQFEEYNSNEHFHWLKEADLAIILDIGDYDRLGKLGEDFKKVNIQTVSIDHHPHPSPNGFAYSIHDVSACATAYLVYEYIKFASDHLHLNNGFGPEIIEGLYIALMTDTGSFRFNNTSAEAHEMASDLIRSGIKPYDLYEKIYESTPIERFRLMASALKSVIVEGDGELAWFTVTREMIEAVGAKDEYVSGYTDIVRTIKGVEVAVMFHEKSGDSCRVNFRSKGRIRIDKLARHLGGGGHAFAAGVVLEMSLEQAVHYVVSETLLVIKSQLEKRK